MRNHGDTAEKRGKQKALLCLSPCRRGEIFSGLSGLGTPWRGALDWQGVSSLS